MKLWRVIIGTGPERQVAAKTARAAVADVIAQLGPLSVAAGAKHKARVWQVDKHGAPCMKAKAWTVAVRWVPDVEEWEDELDEEDAEALDALADVPKDPTLTREAALAEAQRERSGNVPVSEDAPGPEAGE